MNSLTVIQQQCKSSEKCPEWKASRVCSPWGFSSLVRSFLSLVLWDAGSQFSCFSQWCTDPQVSLQNHKPVCTGVIFLAAQADCTSTRIRAHTYTHSQQATLLLLIMMMGGKFGRVGTASSLCSLCNIFFWPEFLLFQTLWCKVFVCVCNCAVWSI